jgi:DeoR/GlpR family transcriptional regulator of sugar metabolism
MLTEERKARLLARLHRDGRLVASALSAELWVSEDTIRRDLRELAAEGLLRRVHGGALPITPAAMLSAAERERAPSAEKQALAAAAARLVGPGQTVLLDGGSTNLLLARQLPRDLSATILTSSPAVALALAEHERLEVVLLGGRLLGRTGTTAGPEAVDAIRAVSADLCFLGVCSLDAATGISCAEREETFVKRAMIERSADVVAVATADKLGAVAPHLVAPIGELARLVTSEAASEERLAPYAAAGVELVRVPVPAPAAT